MSEIGHSGESGLRKFVEVIFKYQTSIAVTFLAVVATVTAGTLLVAPTYEVESKLLIKFGRENIYRSEVGDEQSQIVASNTEEVLNSEASILTSRDLIGTVVAEITVDQLYPDLVTHPPSRGTPLQTAVERFSNELNVDPIKKSSVLQLSLQHKNPEVAARALNLLMEEFKSKHLQAYSDPKSLYLESQLTLYEQRLTTSQNQLQAFKQETGVFSLDEQRTLLLKQRAELDASYKDAQNRILEVQEAITALREQLQTVAQDVPLSTDTERYRAVDDAKNQLLGLQLKEQDLLRQFTERNQLVVSVREEIAIVRGFIARQEEDVKNRIRSGQNVVYQELQKDLLKAQAELPVQQARASSLRTQLAQLDGQIPTLDKTESSLENLKRDLSINDRNYRLYQERVEAARTLEDLNRQKSANVSVIQTAAVPLKAIRPRKLLNIGLAATLGLLGGLAVAFASELSSQGLFTSEGVERRLGLPVLTTIVLKPTGSEQA